jgi:hypothetical protein
MIVQTLGYTVRIQIEKSVTQSDIRKLFRRMNGFLGSEQSSKEGDLSRSVTPGFWSRSGEEREVPAVFLAAVQAATKGPCCVACLQTPFPCEAGR